MGDDGVARLLEDEVGIDVGSCLSAGTGGCDDLTEWIGYVACDPHSRNGSGSGGVGGYVAAEKVTADLPVGCFQSQSTQHFRTGGEARRDHDSLAWDKLTRAHTDTREPVVLDFERSDLPFHDCDVSGGQLLGLLLGEGG